MKFVLTAIFILQICFASSQKVPKGIEWAPAYIQLDNNGLEAEICIDNRFFEGTLLVKEGDKIISLSPQEVSSFLVKNPELNDTLIFKSKRTTFLERSGSKKSFLKETYSGSHYSLYSKYLPDKKKAPFIFPVGGGWIVYGIFSYIEDTEVLFLEKRDHAYQITIPKHNDYPNHFTMDKKLFFQLLWDKEKFIKSYMKEKRLKLNNRPDIINIIEYANTL